MDNDKPIPQDAQDRFWSKVDKSGDCWIWTACKIPAGYGKFRFNSTYQYAHRFAYILTRGSIPDGLHVCHACDNPSCCNPDHLWVGTAADNMHDRGVKGRTHRKYPKGQKPLRIKPPHPPGWKRRGVPQKLNADLIRQIRAIRESEGLGTRKLGQMFNVNRTTIRSIIRGELWSSVE